MKIYLLTALICTAFLYGCKDSTNVNTSGTGSLVGDLKGRIYVLDQNANPISNRSGVLVSCEGTNYSAITDSTGFWVIHDLPTRTYSIAYTKKGFDTIKNTSYTFVGGGTQWLEGMSIVQHPTFEVALDAATIKYGENNAINYYTVFGHSIDNPTVQVRIVFSTTPLFERYEISEKYFFHDVYLNGQFAFSDELAPSYFPTLSKFDTLYVTCYPLSVAQSYFDVQTGKYVQLGLGKQSNVLQIIKK